MSEDQQPIEDDRVEGEDYDFDPELDDEDDDDLSTDLDDDEGVVGE